MKITLSVLIAGLMVFAGISPVDAEDIKPVVRIGIVTDGLWVRHAETVDLFKKEILVLTRDEFDVQFPAEFSLNGGIGIIENSDIRSHEVRFGIRYWFF